MIPIITAIISLVVCIAIASFQGELNKGFLNYMGRDGIALFLIIWLPLTVVLI